ncbi:hypothetical protein BU16DRAFT_280521 [Lophium mytilinum]|uniref:Uncharacterized protein n=1 Tax=Lophium mytilinum TaxID=390894 RepID=A0A6A6R7I4_9PEZI|nr:hypothetical protein BU16DRAFT_280521 [Lophium mytilinum]
MELTDGFDWDLDQNWGHEDEKWVPTEKILRVMRSTFFIYVIQYGLPKEQQMLNGSGHADSGKTVVVFYSSTIYLHQCLVQLLLHNNALLLRQFLLQLASQIRNSLRRGHSCLRTPKPTCLAEPFKTGIKQQFDDVVPDLRIVNLRVQGCGCETVEQGLDGVEGGEVDVAGVCTQCADGEREGGFERVGEI